MGRAIADLYADGEVTYLRDRLNPYGVSLNESQKASTAPSSATLT